MLSTPPKPCRYGRGCFTKGCIYSHEVSIEPVKCRYGIKCHKKECTFAHPISLTSQLASLSLRPPALSIAPKATKICIFYLDNKCTKESCPFRHEMMPPTPASTPINVPESPLKPESTLGESTELSVITKTEPVSVVESDGVSECTTESADTQCKFYSKGICKNGTDCRFKHDMCIVLPPKKANRICTFFQVGKCTKSDCRFIHNTA